MTTHTIKGFIFKAPNSDNLIFHASDGMTDYGWTLVGPHEFEYTLPESFNPVAAEIAGLEKQLDKLNGQHMQRVQEIKGRIKDLQCLAYSPEVSA
jgi:hypothetical protein